MGRARRNRSETSPPPYQDVVTSVPITIEGEPTISFVAGPRRVNAQAVIDELRSLGVNVEEITPDDIKKLRRAEDRVLEWMTFGEGDAESFARDPLKAIQEAAPEVASAVPTPPTLGLPERAAEVTVQYAAFDAAVAKIVGDVIQWAGRSPANAAKLERDPAGAMTTLGADAPTVVKSAAVSALVEAMSAAVEPAEAIPVVPPGAEVPRVTTSQGPRRAVRKAGSKKASRRKKRR
jgi:hypothetical protein